jgi:hypothetical protein
LISQRAIPGGEEILSGKSGKSIFLIKDQLIRAETWC